MTPPESVEPIEPTSLSINRSDPERRLGLRAGRFTQPAHLTALLFAFVVAIAFYAALIFFRGAWIHETFTERGVVPYVVVTLSAWAIILLLVKAGKIAAQRRALRIHILPDDPMFTLSTNSAQQVLDAIHAQVDEPRQFLLFNRIQVALSNLRNMGRIGDVDAVLQSQANHDESVMESSYTIVRGLIWGIPVLGFIGTVIGLSAAIGAFGGVLASTSEGDQLRSGLQNVTAGLAIAFETTLHALVFALAIHLLLTVVRRAEERLLDDCRDYCQRNIVGRLRIVQAEDDPT